MLSDAELQQLMQRLGLSAEAQDIVATIRTSPPSRTVTGRAGNVCVRYPSRKMGVTIQAESHRVELAAIYLMEHDPAVLEYYDQLPSLTLTYRSPTDRNVTVRHTPDFFVLRTDGMAAIIQTHLSRSGGITLAALLAALPADAVDALYTLIATEQIAVDLAAAPLAEPERVVLLSEDAPRAASEPHTSAILPPLGTTVLWDGESWLVINRGASTLALLSTTGTCTHLAPTTVASLHQAGILTWNQDPSGTVSDARSPANTADVRDWQEAYRRYTLLQPVLRGDSSDAVPVPARTQRLWLARYRAAERDLGCGYLGLLPDRHRQGNHATRLDPAVQTLLDEVITTHYERPQRATMRASYVILCQECQRQQLPVPSYKTFVQAVHRRPRTEQVRKRQGERAAYQAATVLLGIDCPDATSRRPSFRDRAY